jgi:hypothetical protein
MKTIENGNKVKITYLPPCINGEGEKNPYIGMEGIIHDFNGKMFNLFTGNSWLVGIHLKTCKFIRT